MFLKKHIFIFFILLSQISFSQKATQSEILKLANNFLSNSKQKELINETPQIKTTYSSKTNKALFHILNYKKAFIIISANKSHTPIKAFSFANNFKINKDNEEANMLNILISDYEKKETFLSKNNSAKQKNIELWKKRLNQRFAKSTNNKIDPISPFLKSIYGQKWFYENGEKIYTTNYYTPNHNPVGCVAITFMELMRYYNWPRKGMGSNSYTEGQANFSDTYYNWDAILDKYKGVTSKVIERKSLGKISYHAAVSVNMDFSSSGSTSNINKIPNAAKKYFRYISEYKESDESDFWASIDLSLEKEIPVQLAIYTESGAGHALVTDGIKFIDDEKFYHINTGWWGDFNGWYKLYSDYGIGTNPIYNIITAAVYDMIPVPELESKPEVNFETKVAKLEWYYPETIPAEQFELQIKHGVGAWETFTDTITQAGSIVFQADDTNNYSFRIRAKVHGKWFDDSWSNILKITPNTFKPKGEKKLSLFPSFVENNKILVSYKNLTGASLSIYDFKGNLVYQKENTPLNEHEINVSNLETGIYILRVINGEEILTKKFMKL